MLALDYRPFAWDDICGQKMLVAEMKKRSLKKDFPTVMFFAGNSGTGKTTMASIIAALINDDNPLKGDGCLNPNPESPESKAIINESFNMSCSMYDASKMNKEDVIQLEEIISSESFFGGKRIFVIDECFLGGTKVRMFNGSVKNIEDIALGDLLMGIDGGPRCVTQLHRGEDMMYAVSSHNKKKPYPYYVCNSKHKVVYENIGYRDRGHFSFDSAENMTKKKGLIYIPFKFIELPKREVRIDPYFFGLWLGDGLRRSPDIITGIKDVEIRDWLRSFAKKIGHNVRERERPSIIQMEFNQGQRGPIACELRKQFKCYGLMVREGNAVQKDKYIPDDYLQNSQDVRLKLLAGIIDSDGQLSKFYNCYMYRIEMARKNLMEQIYSLVMSLGFFPKWHESKRFLNGVIRLYYRVDFYGYGIPCLLPRKQCSLGMIPKRVQKRISLQSIGGNVVEWGRGNYYGVSVDGDNLFLLANGAVVHNCQELTKHSKGVTLKLLEKKRKNAHIILCTMNPDAFDSSIRGRGAFYTFKSPSSSDIAECLFGLIQKLNADVPDILIQEGIFTIADNCEGSVRMAVQTLDRCLTGEFYSADAIQEAFGFMSNAKLFEIIMFLLKKDVAAFKEIKTMDLKEFFYLSYKFISDCMIYQRTQLADAPWKADQYNRLTDYKNAVAELFNLYADIDINMGAYFRNTYCLARLTDFFKESIPQGLVPSSVPARTPIPQTSSQVGVSGHRVRGN